MLLVRSLSLQDYDAVRLIDKATQIQYLGDKWEKLDQKGKESLLVSRKSEFNLNVNTGYSFVVTKNNIIVGFVFAYETLPFKRTIYIRHIAIKPEIQGHGLGGQLIDAVIHKSREKDIKKIISMINTDNPKSMKMHEKSGFILTGRKQATMELK